MKIAIMQPYLFPYIGYFQLINAVDTFVIYDDVNYINRGYINRNSILLNGKPYRFTLELRGASQNKLINEIEVGDNKSKLIKTIGSAYKKAPFFNGVIEIARSLIFYDEKNLAKYISNSLIKLSEYMGIRTNFIYSSEIEKDNSLKGQSKILAICKRLGASIYINAVGGQGLYKRDNFQKEGIDLKFIRSNAIKYKQFRNPFVSNLSIIDVMMFNSKEEIKKMLYYELL